ncbi:MAG: hypothetical protein V4508_16865 [Pseudomonadota bacterium]
MSAYSDGFWSAKRFFCAVWQRFQVHGLFDCRQFFCFRDAFSFFGWCRGAISSLPGDGQLVEDVLNVLVIDLDRLSCSAFNGMSDVVKR